MSFFKFTSQDVINTEIVAYPNYFVDRKEYINITGTLVTGSVYLEKQYLNTALSGRRYQGYSEKLGGFTEKNGPFSASVEILTAVSGGTNKELYCSILNLYSYYSALNFNYTSSFAGTQATTFRVIVIPEIYYDREIKSGSFSASDDTNNYNIFDDGRGGIYEAALTSSIIGNIFYSEGLIVLKDPAINNFGETLAVPPEPAVSFKTWFKGTHKIPVKIFRCRAPARRIKLFY